MTHLGHCDISGDRSWYMEEVFPFCPVEVVAPVVLRLRSLRVVFWLQDIVVEASLHGRRHIGHSGSP